MLVGAARGVGAAAEIFVPTPKTGDETLDDSNTGAASGAKEPEVCVTLAGDTVSGDVVRIDKNGLLELRGPQFEGEVKVRVESLDKIALSFTKKEEGDDEIVLTNGDRMKCRVIAVAEESVIVESTATGTLKIPRPVVQSMAFGKGITTLVASRFEEGRMEPWKSKRGSWSLRDGALFSQSTSYQTIYAQVEQKEAVTVVAKISALDNNYGVRCQIALFADTNANYYGRNSVFVSLQHSELYLQYAQNGSTRSINNRSLGRRIQSGVIRFCYDPETSKARMWLDETDFGEHVVPSKLTSGGYVLFTSHSPCKVEYVNVYPGIVPPAQHGTKGEEETERIQFSNKDRVSAKSVTMAEGVFSVQTSYGELKCPVAKVDNILFRKKGQEVPRRRKGDVRVETADSRMTIRFIELTGEHLLGEADHFGEVKIRRECIKGIRFNVYTERKKSEGEEVTIQPGGVMHAMPHAAMRF